MIKKFAPFLYCLTPLCALAQTVTIDGTTGLLTPMTSGLNVAASDSYIFNGGAGIDVTGGINTAAGFYVGLTPTTPNLGAVYANETVDASYTVTATDAITIGGPLQIESNYSLTIGGAGLAVNLTAGVVDAYGDFTVSATNAVSFAEFVSTDADVVIGGNSLTIISDDFQALGTGTTTVNVGDGAFNVANGAI